MHQLFSHGKDGVYARSHDSQIPIRWLYRVFHKKTCTSHSLRSSRGPGAAPSGTVSQGGHAAARVRVRVGQARQRVGRAEGTCGRGARKHRCEGVANGIARLVDPFGSILHSRVFRAFWVVFRNPKAAAGYCTQKPLVPEEHLARTHARRSGSRGLQSKQTHRASASHCSKRRDSVDFYVLEIWLDPGFHEKSSRMKALGMQLLPGHVPTHARTSPVAAPAGNLGALEAQHPALPTHLPQALGSTSKGGVNKNLQVFFFWSRLSPYSGE